ncbi:protein FAM136A-like [Dermacentor andersoni]|uniref:protein FAM136A-like n=1 Tax=Dermacentor andersoni TaxID=34620 RepID=UPI0021555ED2|nr:protein FAM136A-like [Dermacentor andersoni]
MAEGAALRVQTAVDNMVKELDNSYLRKILGNVHRCAVKCCDNSSLSMDGARTCIMNCSEPLNKAQSKVEGELGNFQERIRMCVMQCENDVRDQMSSTLTEAEASKLKGQYESCVVTCADKHIALLPQMQRRMKELLSQL